MTKKRGLLDCLESDTEAKVVDSEARGVTEALGGTQVRPVADPGTTAIDPVQTYGCLDRVGHRSLRVFPVPIGTPFPNVAVHIVKAPRVGGVLADIDSLIYILVIIGEA